MRDLILSDNKFDNYIKFISQGVSQRKINKEDNKDINSRKKWLEKYNEYDSLLEDIKQIFSYYWSGYEGQSVHETIEKVKNIFLEPDNQLTQELKQIKPITNTMSLKRLKILDFKNSGIMRGPNQNMCIGINNPFK